MTASEQAMQSAITGATLCPEFVQSMLLAIATAFIEACKPEAN